MDMQAREQQIQAVLEKCEQLLKTLPVGRLSAEKDRYRYYGPDGSQRLLSPDQDAHLIQQLAKSSILKRPCRLPNGNIKDASPICENAAALLLNPSTTSFRRNGSSGSAPFFCRNIPPKTGCRPVISKKMQPAQTSPVPVECWFAPSRKHSLHPDFSTFAFHFIMKSAGS